MNTELNNKSMATVVETFFVEETLSLVHDATDLEKWNDLVSFLELTGQKTLTKEEKSPIPFLWMNANLINVFEVLCPTKVEVAKYDKMPIPLQILDLVALSKREEYFDFIEIWYDEHTPDPVCIGHRTVEKYRNHKDEWYRKYNTDKYLIGKWSDVKATFQELITRAKHKYITIQSTSLKQQIKQAARQLEDLEDTVATMFYNPKTTSGDLPF